MALPEIEACWRHLDPVFVRGMQRSGTSVMARALRRLGIVGFGEGHLWFDLLEPFNNLRDPEYQPHLRVGCYALGQGRELTLQKYIAIALDQFHRDHLPGDAERWMDKSPGAQAVRLAPLLAQLFPRAQFIFMYRNGITTVHSATKLWSDHEFWENERVLFETMCRAWAETMSTWRAVREELDGRYIEIAQEELAVAPLESARRLLDFLDTREGLARVAQLFESRRVLSAFPDKPAGDYGYEIDWSPERKDYFVSICGPEMEAWQFDIDFDSPQGRRYGPALSEGRSR